MPHPTAELFLGPPLEDEDLLPDEPWGPWCPHSLPALRRMPAQGGTGWTRTDGRDAAGWAHDAALSGTGTHCGGNTTAGRLTARRPRGPALPPGELLHGCPHAHGLMGVLGDCPRTVYNSCRLEAPCRPTPGPARSLGLSCPREHGAASKSKDLPRRRQKGPPPAPRRPAQRVEPGRDSAVSLLCSAWQRRPLS